MAGRRGRRAGLSSGRLRAAPPQRGERRARSARLPRRSPVRRATPRVPPDAGATRSVVTRQNRRGHRHQHPRPRPRRALTLLLTSMTGSAERAGVRWCLAMVRAGPGRGAAPPPPLPRPRGIFTGHDVTGGQAGRRRAIGPGGARGGAGRLLTTSPWKRGWDGRAAGPPSSSPSPAPFPSPAPYRSPLSPSTRARLRSPSGRRRAGTAPAPRR